MITAKGGIWKILNKTNEKKSENKKSKLINKEKSENINNFLKSNA